MARPISAAAWLMAAALAGASARASERNGTAAPADAGGRSPARVRHEILLTAPEAAADGGLVASGVLTGSDGGVRLEGTAQMRLDPALWFPAAGNPEGWAVEARLRPLGDKGACGSQRSVSINIWDGQAAVTVNIGLDWVSLSCPPVVPAVGRVPTSSTARTYRLERQGARVTLSVEGREVLATDVDPWGSDWSTQWPVALGGSQCSGTLSEWELLAWETAPRPIPAELDPAVIHPATDPAVALEAIASSLNANDSAAAVRALKLSPAVLACAARTVVEDAIRLGARHAFEDLLRPPSQPEPLDLGLPATKGEGGCPAPLMPRGEVVERARLAARTLAKLSTLEAGGLDRARAALAAPPAHPPPPPSIDPLELLRDRKRPGPICDPAGPCDCRPRPEAAFPLPAEVVSATRAADLVERWKDHPQYVYGGMIRAAGALSRSQDQAQLAAHLKAVALGKRTCATRP